VDQEPKKLDIIKFKLHYNGDPKEQLLTFLADDLLEIPDPVEDGIPKGCCYDVITRHGT
jgi:hypothetical protein